jgi:hypothetical protein
MTDLIAELAEVVRLQRLVDTTYGCECESAKEDRDYAAIDLIRTHHATLTRILTDDAAIRAAHTELVIRLGEVTEKLEAANRETHGEREESWEVWQEDMPVAVSDCLPETLHYLAVYQQDGPVTLKRAVVYRETITPEQLAAMHDSAREGGDE